MNITRIPLDTIDLGDRLRPIDPAHVLLIMSSAAETGIQAPIQVRPAKAKGRFTLVAGAHRVEVARQLGHADIPAIVRQMSDDEARLAEIDENVYRHELSDLDRAVFLAEKKAIHERLHPQTGHGSQDRDDSGKYRVAIFGHTADRFTSEVQEQLGYSERTIRRIVARATIAPSVRARLAGTTFARKGSELDALVKLADEAKQHEALTLVQKGGEDAPRTLAAAAGSVSGKRASTRAVDDADAQLAVLMKAWKNAGARARRAFVDGLVAEGDLTMTAALRRIEPEAA